MDRQGIKVGTRIPLAPRRRWPGNPSSERTTSTTSVFAKNFVPRGLVAVDIFAPGCSGLHDRRVFRAQIASLVYVCRGLSEQSRSKGRAAGFSANVGGKTQHAEDLVAGGRSLHSIAVPEPAWAAASHLSKRADVGTNDEIRSMFVDADSTGHVMLHVRDSEEQCDEESRRDSGLATGNDGVCVFSRGRFLSDPSPVEPRPPQESGEIVGVEKVHWDQNPFVVVTPSIRTGGIIRCRLRIDQGGESITRLVGYELTMM
ncbi:hypothetical protein PV04_07009 [Phialophora macrospora]|uniref:Uncharacterized protein n=1 Tax=Phialophora macrospora TaxID=1851006 RepID=A0A0D2FM49_9EURO|nr:hypothetical protein PV04_07009 [Phialophora macrospora]